MKIETICKNLNEIVSLQYHVKQLRSQDKLGKQNFDENMKKVLEPVTDTIKNTSEDLTKTMMLASQENNKELENSRDRLFAILNDMVIITFYSLSLLSKITNPEHTSQFKQINDPNSSRVSDLLKNKTIPVALYDNFLRLFNTDKKFEIQGDLAKMMTNKTD